MQKQAQRIYREFVRTRVRFWTSVLEQTPRAVSRKDAVEGLKRWKDLI